jgi:hypothetical protein
MLDISYVNPEKICPYQKTIIRKIVIKQITAQKRLRGGCSVIIVAL